MNSPLMLRNDPQQLTTRSLLLRIASANEEERSVEAVIATENPVEVYDWRSGEIIEEVLLARGADIPEQLPLLASHNRWNLDQVLGSVREIRIEEAKGGGEQLVGRLFFAKGDEAAERAWNKVSQGHLTDVSVGYRVDQDKSHIIAAGQKATVAGREFKARKRNMRIVARWSPKETSVVPIGADAAAKTRSSSHRSKFMDELRQYLLSIGLAANADDQALRTFHAQLDGDQRAEADRLASTIDGYELPKRNSPPQNSPPPAGEGRSSPEPQRSENQDPDARQIAQEAVEQERERVRELTQLAGEDVPAALRQQAIDEGWDINRASVAFLGAVRQSRQAETDQQTPYHHTAQDRSIAGASVRSLAAGLLIGQGIDPVQAHSRMHDGLRMPLASDELTAEDCDRGHPFRRMSALDLVRECARQDTGRLYWDPDEAIRAATVSGGTLSYVFTTNVYAKLLEGWTQIGDTTAGWCDEEDVANFLQQEDISLQASARLETLPRGGTAKDATVSDTHETYKIARYAKKFTVDEQDIIDDRLGAIMRMPAEMGQSARNLRPDLIYSLILENPTMVADSGAVFNSTAVTTSGGHANLGTAALSNTALKAGITAMVKQRLNRTSANPGQQLQIRPRFLIVPAALEWDARALTSAAALAKLFADSSDPWYAALNLIAQEGLAVVIDDRVGAIGVLDPRNGAARTGVDTNWFLTSGPNRGLRVAYRRGTNRQPQLRSFTLDKGQWGLGWDINLDIGAVFVDWRTWYKSTGAA